MRRNCAGGIVVTGAALSLLFPFAAFATSGAFAIHSAQQPNPRGELIDRTLALVGNQVITLSDVQTAIALGLIEGAHPSKTVEDGTMRLIERLLVLREVQRYAPPEPPDAEIDARIAAIRARFDTPARYQAALDAGGFTDDTVRSWVRDDLRIAAYLAQRFTAANVPGDDEVKAYYGSHRDEFDPGRVTLEQATPAIRERLTAERRTALIDDWVADLRRRTQVVELWRR